MSVLVGRRVRAARIQAGYSSQTAFADVVGIPETTYKRLERGDPRLNEDTRRKLVEQVASKTDQPFTYFFPDGQPTGDEEFDRLVAIERRLGSIERLLRGAPPDTASETPTGQDAEAAAHLRALAQEAMERYIAAYVGRPRLPPADDSTPDASANPPEADQVDRES